MSSGVGRHNFSDFQALSMCEMKVESFREVEGWLWNIEIPFVTEQEKKIESRART